MAQNYRLDNHAFTSSEITLVSSRTLSPTLSRDAVIRDSQFSAMNRVYKENMDGDVLDMLEENLGFGRVETVISNMMALEKPLRTYLENGTFWRESLGPFLEYIAHFQCIKFWGGERHPVSLKELVSDPDTTFFYTNSPTTYEHFKRVVLKPVLRENIITGSSHYGYHRISFLEIIRNAIPSGKEFISLDNLLFCDEFSVDELKERKLIEYQTTSYEKPDHLSSDTSRLLLLLKKELNQRWFRQSLVELHQFNNINQVSLQPLKFREDPGLFQEETLSFMANTHEDANDFLIGININHSIWKAAEKDAGKAHMLIPSILLGICSKRGNLTDYTGTIEKNVEYVHVYRFFLEKALSLYANRLLYGDEDFSGPEADVKVG
jgi:hypothetical protein